MLQIELKKEDDFLKIRETLTRIGIANSQTKTLYQSCHILQKQGLYYIVHFKELLKLDGRVVNFNEEDETRRNDIAKLLEDWGLCDIIEPQKYRFKRDNHFRIINFAAKEQWKLVHKYKIGN